MKKVIEKYFPDLTLQQADQFAMMEGLYREWNARINVISRKDVDKLAIHHVLHSLSIAKVINFEPGTTIMDAGTGGGFPGIPLAVLFPEVQFTLVDSIGKKIKVVEAISQSLGLRNVTTLNTRFESVKETFDFITGRAVSDLPRFYSMVRKAIKKEGMNKIQNGILYLTGGDLDHDMASFKTKTTIYRLADYFDEDFFTTKRLVHLYNL